jgi:hypothetical protein
MNKINKRPIGLSILGYYNMVIAIVSILSLLIHLNSLQMQVLLPITNYSILSPLITSLLALLSGIGILKMEFIFGYVIGNIFYIGAMINILIFNFFISAQYSRLQIISMILFLFCLYLLNFRYYKILKK